MKPTLRLVWPPDEPARGPPLQPGGGRAEEGEWPVILRGPWEDVGGFVRLCLAARNVGAVYAWRPGLGFVPLSHPATQDER